MIKKQMLIAVAILIASPILGRSDANLRDYWPTKEWRYSSPEKQGLHTSNLENMENYLITKLPSCDSILIVRHGYIVFEKYHGKSSEDLRVLQSVTKSVISALLGIAMDMGLIKSLDQKMMEFFPNYDESTVDSSVREITLRHLMTMSANFSAYPDPDFVGAVFEMALARELGKYFVYEGSDPQIVSIIITNVSSLSAADFASKYLFKPIGIETYAWQGSSGYSQGQTGLSLRPRDMARLGYLYLNQGFWDGKQIISRKWIEESTKNQISDLKSIDSFTYTYGYYWWPEEISGYSFYCAAGAGGQVIGVIPDLDIVLTTTATGLDEVAFKSLLEDYIIPAVMK